MILMKKKDKTDYKWFFRAAEKFVKILFHIKAIPAHHLYYQEQHMCENCLSFTLEISSNRYCNVFFHNQEIYTTHSAIRVYRRIKNHKKHEITQNKKRKTKTYQTK